MVPFMMLVVSTLYHKHDAISPFPLFFFCHLSISHREERPCLSYFPQGYQRCHFIVIRKACNMYARGIRRKQRITKWGEVPLLLPPAAFEFCGAVDQQGTVGSRMMKYSHSWCPPQQKGFWKTSNTTEQRVTGQIYDAVYVKCQDWHNFKKKPQSPKQGFTAQIQESASYRKLLREMRSLGQLMWTGDKFKDKALGHADS